MPVRPQGNDLLPEPVPPTWLPTAFPGEGTEPQGTSDPTLPPVAPTEVPTDPAPLDPVTIEPPVVDLPSDSLTSSSSESSEAMAQYDNDSSSSEEEIGGPLARRPPYNFRYKKSDRRRRQALDEVETQAKPTHTPIFLSEFPSGVSPFRSCPGPARYTTA